MKGAERSPFASTAARVASAGGALWGLAVAAALWPNLHRPAARGQLPGFARAMGFAPGDDARRLALAALLAIAGAWAGRLLARRYSASAPRAYAWWGLALSPLFWSLGAGAPAVAAAGPLAVVFLGWLLEEESGTPAREAQLAAAAISAHALVAWTFLAGPLSRRGVPHVELLIVLLALSAALARAAGRGSISLGAPWLAAALLPLPVAFWRTRPDEVCLAAGAAAIVLPLAARLAFGGGRGRVTARRALVTGLLPLSIPALAAAAMLHAPPIANFFEDGHWLMPASEMLRGARPYRDIVPGHGLVTDGLMEAAELQLFGNDYRGFLRGQRIIGAAFWPLLYAAGFAAGGSAPLAFWGTLLTLGLVPGYSFDRLLLAFLVLALAGAASRRRSRRLWIAAGALLAPAFLFAPEFAVYAAAGALAALAVARGKRVSCARDLAAGGAAGGAFCALLLALAGILPSFLEVTFRLMPELVPAYAEGLPPLPPSLSGHFALPGSLAALGDPAALFFWLLPFALAALAILLSGAPAVGQRGRAAAPLLAFFAASALSVIERRHVNYALFAAPLAALLSARWLWGHRRAALPRKLVAAALVAPLVVIARPADFLTGLTVGLAGAPVPTGTCFPTDPPRARGAGFSSEACGTIEDTRRFLAREAFATGDTWLDFANTPLLYFLFDRRCPIRYPEVPFYETAGRQREVIARIEADPHVRAVLVKTSGSVGWIDAVPNQERAPLVWRYIRSHFHPDPAGSGAYAVFWLRNRD